MRNLKQVLINQMLQECLDAINSELPKIVAYGDSDVPSLQTTVLSALESAWREAHGEDDYIGGFESGSARELQISGDIVIARSSTNKEELDAERASTMVRDHEHNQDALLSRVQMLEENLRMSETQYVYSLTLSLSLCLSLCLSLPH